MMSITVKDFLLHNPNARLDLMTPKGLIQLPSDREQWLLTKNGANAQIKVTGTKEAVVYLICSVRSSTRSCRTETAEIRYYCSQTPRLRQQKVPSSRASNTSK